MAQRTSIHRSWPWPKERGTFVFFKGCAGPSKRRSVVTCSVVIVLLAAAASQADASGPGIGLKVGAQTIDRPFGTGKTTRTRFELELASPRFGDDHFDLVFTVGGSSLGSYSSQYVDFVDGVLFEEYYDDDLSVLDIGLTARLYPLGDSRLRPYLGAGIGYFWFLDSWEDEYYETIEDPFDPGVFYTYATFDEGTDNLARGFFPFVSAGLAVPASDNLELLFEVQYHLDKEDAGFDFSGPVYMFGCRLRF
ncbi:MAG: outer membrane beta-barrel protein [Phycisphaerales bacterium]|nr:MAG: outer membrane beta-barrel protein [Phycisphaerales bacterium]